MTKEGSTKIVNFLTPGAGVFERSKDLILMRKEGANKYVDIDYK